MNRKRVPKGQVFLKKEEKISATLAALDAAHTEMQFVEKFKELYPDDWEKIIKRHNAHERLTPEGKSHPMPNPTQYLINTYRNQKRKERKAETAPLTQA
ncbi:hypothetical protein [Acidithiobacillus ferrivorans]|uniref:hypothetical protein n=1 Tax=Acidithiobacillus ferrivorans TaxID=160808 RepID=UPI001C07D10A|nr:hypothetical protein [Acidithiobacillus ferrivorans]